MSTTEPSSIDQIRHEIGDFRHRLNDAIAEVVVGMESIVDQLLIALLVGGHVLVEGVPGTAKTTLAKAFAHALGIEYHRVQFTPDLLPSDVTGTFIFDRKRNEFELRKGPVFCQLLLADEINRAPAKTQAALLEAMQENQVTIEGTTLPLPRPFLVLATQNPVEHEGVYRLPEAQLDRFIMRVEIGYPSIETEMNILALHGGLSTNHQPDDGTASRSVTDEQRRRAIHGPSMPQALVTPEEILRMQSFLSDVYVEPTLVRYVVELAHASRRHADIGLGASPRAALYLMQCGRAHALLEGRHYCTHEDVQTIANAVLEHRLILRPEAEVEGRSTAGVIGELCKSVPVLTEDSDTRRRASRS